MSGVMMNEPTRFVNKKRLNNKTGKEDELTERYSNLEGCKSVDLDEIFQFSAARQRALERNSKLTFDQRLKNFVPHRVFIHHVDSFNGKVIADYLSEQTVGVGKLEATIYEDEETAEEASKGLDTSGEDAGEEAKENATKQSFEIIGTVDFMKNPNYTRPETVTEVVDEEKKDEFLAKLLTCGIIIYDISSTLSCHPVQIEEATWILDSIANQLEDVQRHAPKLFKKYKDRRTFVLISPLMTWAKTKPIDPDDPSLPLTERDYRKRKPHPNYKVHCDFEKRVLEIGKKFPNNLRTIVIGSGVTYGSEEDVLHFLFKMAWLNAPQLPIFKPGNNKIPLIHVNALANIVHEVLDNFPAMTKYIVAVEQESISLRKIVKLLAKKLGTGKVVGVSKEEAFTYPDIKQRNYDMLTTDLNIIPGYIVNNMELKFDATFKESIDAIIAEFRQSRNLKPIKIFIHGPPASGKTFLSRRLANHYKIHHLHVEDVIRKGMQDMRDRIEEIKDKEKKRMEKEEREEELDEDAEEDIDVDEESEGEEEEEEGEDVDSLTQLLNEMEDNMASNERNRLDEQFVLRLFKKRMLSNACQNQGFVIDGYPKTIEDTRTLYEPEEGVEEENEEDEEKANDVTRLYNKKIMPDFVASLDASDEFLIEKVIKMPQSKIQNTHYEETEMCRRLVEYRASNTEDNTPLIFYDELEVYPFIYNVEDSNDDAELNHTFRDILRQIGPPRNYAPNEELEELRREKEKKDAKYMEDVKQKARQMTQERREKMENWMLLKNQEKEMEEKALALLAMPLRHYLMKYIFPTLTRGLVEVARVRPQDPVDYLAEFLFKENPEGKMFHPNYNDGLEQDLMDAAQDHDQMLGATDRGSDVHIRETSSVDGSAAPDAVSNVTEVKAKCSNLSVESSKRGEEKRKGGASARDRGSDRDDASSGSCKCVRTSTRKSGSSSASSSSSTPPAPPSACTCPLYPSSDSNSSSVRCESYCSDDAVPTCRCPH